MTQLFRAALYIALAICSRPASADDCDAIAERIAARVGGSIEPRSQDAVPISHPDAASMRLYCASGRAPHILSMTTYDARPPATFFDLAGFAGAILTTASPAAVRIGAMDCHRRALRSKDELAKLHFGPLRYECQAFTRDGGGTGLAIYRRRPG